MSTVVEGLKRGRALPAVYRYVDGGADTLVGTVYFDPDEAMTARQLANGDTLYTDIALTTPLSATNSDDYYYQVLPSGSSLKCDYLCEDGGIGYFDIITGGEITGLGATQNSNCSYP